MADSFDEVMAEIRGRVVFAWWPVPLYTGASGYFRTGRWAWLRKVLRRRRLGFPSYFHTEIAHADR